MSKYKVNDIVWVWDERNEVARECVVVDTSPLYTVYYDYGPQHFRNCITNLCAAEMFKTMEAAIKYGLKNVEWRFTHNSKLEHQTPTYRVEE